MVLMHHEWLPKDDFLDYWFAAKSIFLNMTAHLTDG